MYVSIQGDQQMLVNVCVESFLLLLLAGAGVHNAVSLDGYFVLPCIYQYQFQLFVFRKKKVSKR